MDDTSRASMCVYLFTSLNLPMHAGKALSQLQYISYVQLSIIPIGISRPGRHVYTRANCLMRSNVIRDGPVAPIGLSDLVENCDDELGFLSISLRGE